MMGRHLSTAIVTLVLIAAPLGGILLADYPVPSKYQTAWELTFRTRTPQRIVVNLPDRGPTAFWYLPYSVTNATGKERMFLPFVELVTNDGKVIRSDMNIPQRVLDAIKDRERNPLLESAEKVGGEVRLGEEQARDAVAIWEEPSTEMGQFKIYFSGLSGETATINAGGKDVILRKTLELSFTVHGDDVRPGDDLVVVGGYEWVMR